MTNELKEIVKGNNGLSALFLYMTKNNCSSFIQGEASDIRSLLLETSKQDKTFATIIKTVARELNDNSLDPEMPQELRDILTGKKKSGLIDLPGGHKGIALDPENIKNMSDSDIDDIIDGIVGNTDDEK